MSHYWASPPGHEAHIFAYVAIPDTTVATWLMQPGRLDALIHHEVDRVRRDCVRQAARLHGQSEDWVRAYSVCSVQNRAPYVSEGLLMVCHLVVDTGGYDPCPCC